MMTFEVGWLMRDINDVDVRAHNTRFRRHDNSGRG
jgi:hypothetical protein